jgi:hypothetical protein
MVGPVEADILKTVGQTAGIGGIALGVLLIVFRNMLSKTIFPKLPTAEAYRLLRLIAMAVWSVAMVGVLAYVAVVYLGQPNQVEPTVKGDCGSVVAGRDISGSNVTAGNCRPK